MHVPKPFGVHITLACIHPCTCMTGCTQTRMHTYHTWAPPNTCMYTLHAYTHGHAQHHVQRMRHMHPHMGTPARIQTHRHPAHAHTHRTHTYIRICRDYIHRMWPAHLHMHTHMHAYSPTDMHTHTHAYMNTRMSTCYIVNYPCGPCTYTSICF
jgi:hypothetical protein